MRSFLIIALLSALTFLSAPGHADEGEHFMNVRVSPLGLLIGYVNVDVDFALNDQFTLGPTITYWNWKYDSDDDNIEMKVKSFAWGLRGNYYASGVYNDGWYISPYIHTARTKVSGSNSVDSVSADVNNIAVAAVVGYHWFWDNFNMNLGAGYSFSSKTKFDVKHSDGTTEEINNRAVGLVFDFMLGWAF